MSTTIDTTEMETDEFRATCAAAVIEYGGCIYDSDRLSGTSGLFEADSAMVELDRFMSATQAVSLVGHPGEPNFGPELLFVPTEDRHAMALSEVIAFWVDWCEDLAGSEVEEESGAFYRTEAEKARRALVVLTRSSS